jgi:hypothetical protein
MEPRKTDSETGIRSAGVNAGYAAFQLAKALTTSEHHEDPATRARARERAAKWEVVIENLLAGSADYGSRTPVDGVPEWATLEVVTGGFATGQLLAGGELLEHERSLLKTIPISAGSERLRLNAFFLSDAGWAKLQSRLHSGCYDVNVPEEGALMVVAWLAENGHAEEARELLDKLSAFFGRLRFYPIPLEQPRHFGSNVHVQDVGHTISNLQKIKPNERVLAQKEAVEIWGPLHDEVVGLFLETVKDGWPCQDYPNGWLQRARQLLSKYAELRKTHKAGGKAERPQGHAAQLREFLARCATKPESLTGREVGRIRLILNKFIEKRGSPGSQQCSAYRRRQLEEVAAPMFYQIAGVVVHRLEAHARNDGLDDVSQINQPVTHEEFTGTGVPESTEVPECIQRKVERCLNETVAELVERDLITSGEMLARVLPQMTSGIRAAGIADSRLRQLYAAIYRAFRRRRSLLLLNLEKQVQIEELPWIAAIEKFRSESLSSREAAAQVLEELTVLTLSSFPHAIIPNKLLQEFRSLVKVAELDVPLVEEVAADIFMGEFSGKFVHSAKRAASLLNETLYATYYGINYEEILALPESKEQPKRLSFWRRPKEDTDPFVRICASRAGVSLGTWDPATNGMIIEQQQILTTQNLATLWIGLQLQRSFGPQLAEMARQCFKWICKRQQMKAEKFHARLIMLKNTAYGWRQMLFFLALLPTNEVSQFIEWAERNLNEQGADFRNRFAPALKGLLRAAEGKPLENEAAIAAGARRFCGWSKATHWLLLDKA